MTRLQRLSPLLLSALMAACTQAQPFVQAPEAPAAQGVVVDAGLGNRTATLDLRAAAAYALQQSSGSTSVHRWVPADLVRYDVELRVRNATSPGQFDAVGTGLSVQVPVNAQGAGTASFTSLRQGSFYRAYVKAMGKAGGTANQRGNVVQMNAQAQNDQVDFDFTAANDVATQVNRSVTVTFDNVAFSGTGALAFGSPVPGVYASPSSGPMVTVSGPPTPPPPAVVGSYPTISAGTALALDPQGQVWVAGDDSFALGKSSSLGSFLGQFQTHYAQGVAVDAQGQVWVGDNSSQKVMRYANSGSLLGEHTAGASPAGLVYDPLAGVIWVANQGSGTVTKLATSGSVLGHFSVGFIPRALAVDAQSNLWVSNQGGNSLSKLASNGSPLFTVEVSTPAGVGTDAQGNAWVANGSKVFKFSSAGSLLGSFFAGSAPRALAVDAQGGAWVANSGSANLTRLASDGSVLGTYSVGANPTGVAIGAQGQVWVLNRNSGTLTLIR